MLPAALSTTCCLFLTYCYWRRPDACAALTVFPVWFWLLPGLLIAALSWRMPRAALMAAGLWLAYLLLLAEEPYSLLGGLLGPPVAEVSVVRVVSLNCAGGSEAAADEVCDYKPDILLLQESPSRQYVEALGRRLYHEAVVVWNYDAALVARGELLQPELPQPLDFAALARLRLQSGEEAVVASVRLTPPLVRADLWNPACWRAQADNRRFRHKQVARLVSYLRSLPPNQPLIIGGDWNAPADDGALRQMRPLLSDVFPLAGRGWGNTHMNDLPILRIDQVWVNAEWRKLSVTAHRTQNSDHRLVLCELQLISDSTVNTPRRAPSGQ